MKHKLTLEEYVTTQSLISRRELLKLLKANAVQVNAKIELDMSRLISPQTDAVKVGTRFIENKFGYLYYVYYKPKGMLSTMIDPKNRLSIGDMIQKTGLPLFPIGRLDRQTTGIMILTNDGAFSHALMHPSSACEKRYTAILNKELTKQDVTRLGRGVFLDDGPVCYTDVALSTKTDIQLTTCEGRNRLIRRTFEHLGYQIVSLKRLAIEEVTLKGLVPGEMKPLSKAVIMALKKRFQQA